MSHIEAVGMGALNIDYLYRVNDIIIDGETSIESTVATPGGSAANTIYGLAKLGVKSGFIGATGNDEEGKTSVESLAMAGVDTSQIQAKEGEKTGYTLCLSDKRGRRSLYISAGANNLLEWQDVHLSHLEHARIIHLSSFVSDRQFNLQIEMVRKLPASIKVSFSPGMLYASRGMRALSPLLERTHILFANKGEIELLTGREFISGTEECIKSGCRIVVVTMGKGIVLESGKVITSYIRHGDKTHKIEPLFAPGEAFSPHPEGTGAGDAFAAGFLFGFLRGKDMPQCGALGNRVALHAINQSGAREGLSTLPLIAAL